MLPAIGGGGNNNSEKTNRKLKLDLVATFETKSVENLSQVKKIFNLSNATTILNIKSCLYVPLGVCAKI